jgi:hypothetical protein
VSLTALGSAARRRFWLLTVKFELSSRIPDPMSTVPGPDWPVPATAVSGTAMVVVFYAEDPIEAWRQTRWLLEMNSFPTALLRRRTPEQGLAPNWLAVSAPDPQPNS